MYKDMLGRGGALKLLALLLSKEESSACPTEVVLAEEGWLAKRDGVVPFSENFWGIGMTFDTPLLAAGSFT